MTSCCNSVINTFQMSTFQTNSHSKSQAKLKTISQTWPPICFTWRDNKEIDIVSWMIADGISGKPDYPRQLSVLQLVDAGLFLLYWLWGILSSEDTALDCSTAVVYQVRYQHLHSDSQTVTLQASHLITNTGLGWQNKTSKVWLDFATSFDQLG